MMPALLTTSWDDGHVLDGRIADLLAKYDLTGTFYIPLSSCRPILAPPEIRRLSRSFEVGAHTVHHAILTDVPDELAEKEIGESKIRLENITGQRCSAFCFPSGRFRRNHLSMLRQAGFRSARTVELLSTEFPKQSAGIDLVPTTVQVAAHSWLAYARNCAKRFACRNAMNWSIHARSRDWVQTARSMLQLVAKKGGVFHLWGHSWEIEEQRQWSHLEFVFRELRDFRCVARCVPNSKINLSGVPRGL